MALNRRSFLKNIGIGIAAAPVIAVATPTSNIVLTPKTRFLQVSAGGNAMRSVTASEIMRSHAYQTTRFQAMENKIARELMDNMRRTMERIRYEAITK